MYFEAYTASEIGKMETKQAERRAAERYRFRNIRTPQSRALTSVLTSVFALFIR